MIEEDERVGQTLDWIVRQITLNTIVVATIKPKHGLKLVITTPIARQIEDILKDACEKINSIAYKELS